MKRYLLIAATGLILAACGTNQSFTKKRHGHRHWIKKDSDLAELESNNQQAESRSQTEDPITADPAPLADEPQEVVPAAVPVVEQQPQQEQQAAHVEVQPNEKREVKDIDVEQTPRTRPESTPSRPLEREQKKPGSKDDTDDDTELILYVILAILIPPLAVALYEGITNRFWLNLILALLGSGLILFGGTLFYLGGLFLVAIIHAILIVTGTI